MSTAAISSESIYQEIQSFYQNRQADVKQLGGALQSGDLAGAEQAYNALAALGQSGPFANSEPFSKSSRTQDFETIGQDLQAGDLAGAQAAFAALISKQGNATASAQATPAAVVTLSTQAGGTNAPTAVDNPSSIYQQLQAYQHQRQADLNQLGEDLQAGNLNAAQQDFNTLTDLGQSGPNANGQLFQRADRAQDFQTIGQALQSGDLAGAQSAFASLASTFGQRQQGVVRPPSSLPPVGLVPPSTINLPPVSIGPSPVAPPAVEPPVQLVPPSTVTLSPPASSNVPEITINLGVASSSGASGGSATPELVINIEEGGPSSATPEEVTINLGGGSSGATVSIGAEGNSSEQVIINLNQQSNNELTVDVLNSSAASQSASNSGSSLSVTV
jgi:hypothetical protein